MTARPRKLFVHLCLAVWGAFAGGAIFADAAHSHDIAFGQPGKASEVTRTIDIMMDDNFFDPPAVSIKAGETVRFVLTNSGILLHEFNIGTPAMHVEHQKEMAEMVRHGMLTRTGINEEMMKMDHAKLGLKPMTHDDPNSVLVPPGQKKELIWKFTRAMELEFACNVPGHYDAGMVGKVQFAR
jgi:uncharacterized cupredoxin-like copper-binding protein